jgi:hypothetical protein
MRRGRQRADRRRAVEMPVGEIDPMLDAARSEPGSGSVDEERAGEGEGSSQD